MRRQWLSCAATTTVSLFTAHPVAATDLSARPRRHSTAPSPNTGLPKLCDRGHTTRCLPPIPLNQMPIWSDAP